MKTKLLIEVDGGVVQRVAADTEVEIYLIDHDNLRSGDDLQNARTPYLATIVTDVNDEISQALKLYEKRRS